MERTIGLIPGTGKQSQGIAKRLGLAGYKVMIGSRTKEKAERIATELNEKLSLTTFHGDENLEVVKQCDILFLVLPYEYLYDSLQEFMPHFKPNAIIVDVIVPLTFKAGNATCLDDVPEKSVSEYIQSLVPEGVSVVGGFKTISASKLNKIDSPMNVDVFLSANNQEAKEIITEMITKIDGLTVLDSGPLMYSRTTELMTAFVINLNKRNKLKHASFRIISDKH